MYMNDIKVFAKNERELEPLIQSIRIYIQDIGMRFGKEICAMLKMKSGKKTKEGKEIFNQEFIRTLEEKENYKYLGIWEADTIKQVEMMGK